MSANQHHLNGQHGFPGVVPARDLPRLHAATRLGGLELGDHAGAFWLVLRGQAQVVAKEGEFVLEAGDWIALDSASEPQLQVPRSGLVVGVTVPVGLLQALAASPQFPVYFLGRGCVSLGERRETLSLWRRHGAFDPQPMQAGSARAYVALFSFLSSLQRELHAGVQHCPGQSQRRKRQVFLRMQRAWLQLQGRADCVMRIHDLARSSNFSLWYFTKVFGAVYGMGPQQFGVQMRLGRACDLLANSKLSISEIAAECGFESPCSFARAFRAQYRVTASAYRDSLFARDVRGFAAAVA